MAKITINNGGAVADATITPQNSRIQFRRRGVVVLEINPKGRFEFQSGISEVICIDAAARVLAETIARVPLPLEFYQGDRLLLCVGTDKKLKWSKGLARDRKNVTRANRLAMRTADYLSEFEGLK